MPDDLKLSQIGSSPCRLHSGDFTLPEDENAVKLSSPVISGNRPLKHSGRLAGKRFPRFLIDRVVERFIMMAALE